MNRYEDVTIAEREGKQIAIGFFADAPVIFIIAYDGTPIAHALIKDAASYALCNGKTPAQIAWLLSDQIEAAGCNRPKSIYIM